MLNRYGDIALEESAGRTDELAAAGDDGRVAVWRRIMAAIVQLATGDTDLFLVVPEIVGRT